MLEVFLSTRKKNFHQAVTLANFMPLIIRGQMCDTILFDVRNHTDKKMLSIPLASYHCQLCNYHYQHCALCLFGSHHFIRTHNEL